MSDRAQAILDAAEKRIRDAGYNGFSFREIAADVGVKSSSVHHHFPTKDALAVAVARRYTARFEAAVEEAQQSGATRIAAWRSVFRRALVEDGRMCLCGILAAGIGDLPPEVADEARHFFARGLENLMLGGPGEGMSAVQARQTLAVLEGAMLLAKALNDNDAFDEAAAILG